MTKVMLATTLVNKIKEIATKYKTLYVMGCFGSPMTSSNKSRYTKNYSYNMQLSRSTKINNAEYNTFGFDCVCLIKGILWGWSGKTNATYGGAKYASNGVPDKNANQMFNNYCTDISTNFNTIVPGEFLWMSGHIGIYIGDGLAVECTPIWKDGVQITAVGNIGSRNGYNTRTWTKHGKSNFINYDGSNVDSNLKSEGTASSSNTNKFNLGDEVIISGNLYITANYINTAGKVTNKKTKITRYVKNAKHPYNTTGDLGWMDEDDIKFVSSSTTSKITKTVNATLGLNLRSKATTNSSVILTIPHKKVVEVLLENAGNNNGYIWSKVKYNSKTGYVANKYLK